MRLHVRVLSYTLPLVIFCSVLKSLNVEATTRVWNVKVQIGPDAKQIRVRIISVNISSDICCDIFVWFMCRSELNVPRQAQLFSRK